MSNHQKKLSLTRRLVLAACSASLLSGVTMFASSAVAQEASKDAKIFRMAAASNKGHPQVLGIEKFAELVLAKSGGKMLVKLYPGSALGPDIQIVSGMQGGTIDLNVMNASLLAGNVKEMMILDFPYFFKSSEEADAVLDGPFGKKLMDKLPARGLVGLTYFELGFREMHNRKRPIYKADDLKGLKMRVIPTPIYVDFMNAIGANAIAMPYPETYPALEQGIIDGMTNPLLNFLDGKFEDVTKNLTITNHMYSPQIVIMSKKSWDKLSPDEQKVFKDAATEATVYQRKVAREQMTLVIENAKKAGVLVTELPPAEIDKLRVLSKPVIDKYTKEVGPDLVHELNEELAKLRK